MPEPEPAPAPQPERKAAVPKSTAASKKRKVTGAKKDDLLKKFISAKILRDDAEDAAVPKEELYVLFSRWCREQKKGTVQDAKSVSVALKTRFAFREKTIGGTPCWTGVRLK